MKRPGHQHLHSGPAPLEDSIATSQKKDLLISGLRKGGAGGGEWRAEDCLTRAKPR